MKKELVNNLVDIISTELCSNWTIDYIENVILSHESELDELINCSQADAMLYIANKQYQRGKKDGINEVLENFPKWIKCNYTLLPANNDHCRILYNGYSIDINDLFEKLPKND